MSPFERQSDAKRLIKATDLREICSISQAKKNVLDYYRDSENVQNGSGDENITILQSPSTEGTVISLFPLLPLFFSPFSLPNSSLHKLYISKIKDYFVLQANKDKHSVFLVWLSGFWTT